MKKFIVLFFIIFSNSAFCQEKTDTIRINNNGNLNIELDSRINNILKVKEDAVCTHTTPNRIIKKDPVRVKPNDPCAGTAQVNGFKIQIYYSKNRSEADKVRNDFSSNYPSLSSQVTYYAPDYRVLIGDYLSKNSASKDIRRLKSKYNSAFSIPFKVLCRKAL